MNEAPKITLSPTFLHLCKVYVLEITPTPWARPGGGRVGRRYDTQKILKQQIKNLIIYQNNNEPPMTGAIEFNVTFFMPIPLTTTQKYSKQLDGSPHTLRPDTDNLLKLLLDCCTMAELWTDDAQISKIIANKVYAKDNSSARTEFYLRKL